MTTELTPREVAHVAKLARLEIDDAERDKLAIELSAVLSHVEAIRKLETSGLPPTAHAFELSNVLRSDVVGPSLDRAEVLAAAPDVASNRFRVPRILAEES